MVDIVNKLDLSDQQYHTNGNVGDDKYKEKLLFLWKTLYDLVNIACKCILFQPDY